MKGIRPVLIMGVLLLSSSPSSTDDRTRRGGGGLFVVVVAAWDVTRVSGIWKLKTRELPLRRVEPTILERALGKRRRRPPSSRRSSDVDDDEQEEVLLLQLNADGSFRQCDEGYVEGAWIRGTWTIMEERKIKFILNRQYYGPPFDIAMEGELPSQQTRDDIDSPSAITAEGHVCQGRVTLPRSDPNYFQRGFDTTRVLGPFHMIQSVKEAIIDDASYPRDGALLEDDGVFQ